MNDFKLHGYKVMANNRVKHGLTHSKEFAIWQGIKQRVDPRDIRHKKRYFDRGIKMYPLWEKSFIDFYEYLRSTIGLWPGGRYTIDRIDNDRGYEPENLRWATPRDQMRNRCSTRFITHARVTRSLTEWGELTGLGKARICQRLKQGWSIKSALTIAPMSHRERRHVEA